MLVGTHADGREVEYNRETEQYTVGGQTVTLKEVLGFAGAGELTWASDELREWARGLVSGNLAPPSSGVPTSPVAPVAQVAPTAKEEGVSAATDGKVGWFTRLPLWGKVLFVLFWPVSVCYGVFWMWKNRKYTQPVRVLLTAGAVVMFAIGFSSLGTPGTMPAATTQTTTSSAAPPSTPAPPQPAPAPKPVKLTAAEVTAKAFGSFDSPAVSGKGDSVVQLPAGVEVALLTADYQGSGNFALWTMDASNGQKELLVNTIGQYNGTTLYSEGSPTKLKVTASGRWSIQVKPVSVAAPMGNAAQGTGDAVLLYDGPAANLAINHTGKSNFVVKTISTSGNDLLVNDIGNYSGVVPGSEGPLVITINADGAWSIAAQ